jgi:cAMP-dependent protein kinase regulator
MDRFDRMRLADAFEEQEFEAGEDVVREGDVGDSFFVIERGEARVVRAGVEVNVLRVRVRPAPSRQPLTRCPVAQPGSYFGEVAMLRRQPRLATVTALTPLRVARLDADAFQRLIPDRVRGDLEAAADQYSATPRAAS